MFIETIIEKASKDIKTIILPEATDIRVLKATETITHRKIANIILLGNEEKIKKVAEDNSLDISLASIIDPNQYEDREALAKRLYELRKNKGMTVTEARKLVSDEIHFGMMLLKTEKADGLVCGATHSTADTLRPALQILKTKENTKLVSGFFIMDVPNCEYGSVYLFSDCGINPDPNSDELSEIAIASAKSYEQLIGGKAKIGMLSYSTYGSAKSDSTRKVIDATMLAKLKAPDLLIDGELQLDAAIAPEVAEIKANGSRVAGICNTLIFPNLDAGNIGYKLVQRMCNAKAYGPLCQGIAKPVNDLSRGCSDSDIVGVVAITAVQAQQDTKNSEK